jgi:hypothetical protein
MRVVTYELPVYELFASCMYGFNIKNEQGVERAFDRNWRMLLQRGRFAANLAGAIFCETFFEKSGIKVHVWLYFLKHVTILSIYSTPCGQKMSA